jgi:hypothetical protein
LLLAHRRRGDLFTIGCRAHRYGERMTKQYSTSAKTERVDRARVHSWRSQQSYWAQGRPRETQDAAIDGPRNYGVYDEDTPELRFA